MKLEIIKQTVEAKTIRLSARWTFKAIEDWDLKSTENIIENGEILDKEKYTNDTKIKYIYKVHNSYLYHRTTGPAVIIYENDEIIEEQYWIVDKQIPNELVKENPTILTDAKLRKILL